MTKYLTKTYYQSLRNITKKCCNAKTWVRKCKKKALVAGVVALPLTTVVISINNIKSSETSLSCSRKSKYNVRLFSGQSQFHQYSQIISRVRIKVVWAELRPVEFMVLRPLWCAIVGGERPSEDLNLNVWEKRNNKKYTRQTVKMIYGALLKHSFPPVEAAVCSLVLWILLAMV